MALAIFDRQEVDRFAQQFEELFYRGDAATMTSFYAQDAMIMAPDTEAVRGRLAVQEFRKAACEAAQRMGMKRTINVQRMERSGDLGYVVSTVILEIQRLMVSRPPSPSTTSRSGRPTPTEDGGPEGRPCHARTRQRDDCPSCAPTGDARQSSAR
jgi:ketosteroid isomerase-like protein